MEWIVLIIFISVWLVLVFCLGAKTGLDRERKCWQESTSLTLVENGNPVWKLECNNGVWNIQKVTLTKIKRNPPLR